MLIVFEMAPAAIIQRFVGLDPTLLEPYRDASFNAPNFGLTLLDCWSGIQRAMEHRWLARPSKHNSQLWGRINIAEYAQYDEPLNADLHEVIPGKLVAFPQRADSHSTPALRAAAEALAEPVAPAPPPPLPVEPTPIVRLPETRAQRFRRAQGLETDLARGLALTAADLLWLGGYREGSEYLSLKGLYDDFGEAALK